MKTAPKFITDILVHKSDASLNFRAITKGDRDKYTECVSVFAFYHADKVGRFHTEDTRPPLLLASFVLWHNTWLSLPLWL